MKDESCNGRNGEKNADCDCCVEESLFQTTSFLKASRKTVSAECATKARF